MALRVVVVGCGRISDLHLRAYAALPDADVVAVVDPNAGRAEAAAARYGITRTAPSLDFVDLDGIDLVEILVPHDLHRPLAEQAMAAGCHVSVQKPMAVTVDDAEAMVQAAAAARVHLKVFEHAVAAPAAQLAHRLIEEGAIGDPRSIRLSTWSGGLASGWKVPLDAWVWRLDPTRGGGWPLLFDDGHHKLALAWWLLGPVDEVHTFVSYTEVLPGQRIESPALASWRHASGAVGSLEVVHAAQARVPSRYYSSDDQVAIMGSAGLLWLTAGTGRTRHQAPVIVYRDGETIAYEDVDDDWATGFAYSTAEFAAFLAGEVPSYHLTGTEGLEVLRLARAVVQSAEEGRRVKVHHSPGAAEA